MQDKKDLNDILSSIDPRLRDKLMSVSQLSEEKTTPQENIEEINEIPAEIPEETAEISEEAAEVPHEEKEEAPAIDTPFPEQSEPEEEISDSLKEAKEQAADILAYGLAPKTDKKQISSFAKSVREIILLELVSLALFFLSLKDGIPSNFSLFAILLPALVGIGSRLLVQKLSLKEAVLKCKWHIILTFFIFICIVLSI